MIDFLVYALSGKLVIFLSKKFPPIQSFFQRTKLLKELYSCNMCYGFWVYLLLALGFENINVDQIKNTMMNKTIIAGFTTFIVHLISIGWDELFSTVWVTDAPRELTE